MVTHVPRCFTKHRYVLHLFSGVRRPGDFHTSVLALKDDSGLTLFPISIDIILSKDHGDLLSGTTQAFWIRLALAGAIHFVLGGPPCETWSISRWRYYEDNTGPKPLRSGMDLMGEIWGWQTLRLRDLRQLLCSNGLLTFMIRIFCAQLIAQGAAVIEHPSQPGQRGGVQPPSIWLLPILQFLMTNAAVFRLQIHQGFWNALSPKPTTLLFTAPGVSGPELLAWMNLHRTKDVLPPPIAMGKTNNAEGVYSTAQLKRYPAPLCEAFADVTMRLKTHISQQSPELNRVDPVYSTAATLRSAYLASSLNADDGADFHEFNAAF